MQITRNLSIEPLLDITDPEFAHQYSMGVWWAMYGDKQGHGIYADDYLIGNITRNLRAGRYSSLSSSWLPTSGFYFGMLHGGWLVKESDTLVTLTDQLFAKGYHDGRKHSGRLTDGEITALLHTMAHNRQMNICYLLGNLTGRLSLAVLPAITNIVSKVQEYV